MRGEAPKTGIDYGALYDEHEEYAARRIAGSPEQQTVLLEVTEFKIPNLVAVAAGVGPFASVLEIGCATGELIGNFPIAAGGRRSGCDISAANVAAARQRFPRVEFVAGDFAALPPDSFECVILSDVLEHVEDDIDFLRRAARLGRYVLINLPLEDRWINRRRRYGPSDASGHLRAYSLEQGLELIRAAGLLTLASTEVWIHEAEVDRKRRELRKRYTGSAHSGSPLAQVIKAAVYAAACAVQPFGRRLFPSNLFALAGRGGRP